MKKIIIALDYTQSSEKVVSIGYDLAQSMHAKIMLLHVVADPVYYSSDLYSPILGFVGNLDIDAAQLDEKGLDKAAQDFLDRIKTSFNDDLILTQVAHGEPSTTILESGKEFNADLIIMGSHSRRWLDKILMGSVAEAVLKHSKMPLLIIPTHSTN